MSAVDVVVIGGGVIGCSVAYYAAKKGYSVVIIEREDIASGSSGACDGAISVHLKKPGIHLKLALESLRLFPRLQNEIEDNIHLLDDGSTMVYRTVPEREVVEGLVRRQEKEGIDIKLLNYQAIKEIQPALGSNIMGGMYCSSSKHVHPQSLCLALFRSAKKHGARFMLRTEAVDIKVANGRVESVYTNHGDEIKCRFIVNACGAWAPFIGRMVNVEIPIVPRRGQLLVSEPVPRLIYGGLNSAQYLASKFQSAIKVDEISKQLGLALSMEQTKSYNLLIGGTREFKGYDRRTTYRAFKEILKHAAEIVPALKNIHIIRSFAGLRPYTPDSIPIIGPVPQVEGFFIAAGHEGDGICLSQITGSIIAAMLAGENISDQIELNKISVSRFSEKMKKQVQPVSIHRSLKG